MTKVGQLSEEEKLAYAKEESERTKKEMAATMLQKGYPIREIADIIQGLSLDEILALKKHKTAVMCKKVSSTLQLPYPSILRGLGVSF